MRLSYSLAPDQNDLVSCQHHQFLHSFLKCSMFFFRPLLIIYPNAILAKCGLFYELNAIMKRPSAKILFLDTNSELNRCAYKVRLFRTRECRFAADVTLEIIIIKSPFCCKRMELINFAYYLLYIKLPGCCYNYPNRHSITTYTRQFDMECEIPVL